MRLLLLLSILMTLTTSCFKQTLLYGEGPVTDETDTLQSAPIYLDISIDNCTLLVTQGIFNSVTISTDSSVQKRYDAIYDTLSRSLVIKKNCDQEILHSGIRVNITQTQKLNSITIENISAQFESSALIPDSIYTINSTLDETLSAQSLYLKKDKESLTKLNGYVKELTLHLTKGAEFNGVTLNCYSSEICLDTMSSCTLSVAKEITGEMSHKSELHMLQSTNIIDIDKCHSALITYKR